MREWISIANPRPHAALPDAEAARHGQVRIIDESGEDYPAKFSAPVELSRAVRRAVLAAV